MYVNLSYRTSQKCLQYFRGDSELYTLKIHDSRSNEDDLHCLWKGRKQQIYINISAGAMTFTEWEKGVFSFCSCPPSEPCRRLHPQHSMVDGNHQPPAVPREAHWFNLWLFNYSVKQLISLLQVILILTKGVNVTYWTS